MSCSVFFVDGEGPFKGWCVLFSFFVDGEGPFKGWCVLFSFFVDGEGPFKAQFSGKVFGLIGL